VLRGDKRFYWIFNIYIGEVTNIIMMLNSKLKLRKGNKSAQHKLKVWNGATTVEGYNRKC
jgi:hypothetical protein